MYTRVCDKLDESVAKFLDESVAKLRAHTMHSFISYC